MPARPRTFRLLGLAVALGLVSGAAAPGQLPHPVSEFRSPAVTADPVWTPDEAERHGGTEPGAPDPLAPSTGLSGGRLAPADGGEPGSDRIGLEKFYQYSGTSAGPGLSVRVDQANGDAVVTTTPVSVPGRGLASFVQLSYNSLDGTDSPAGPGWSLAVSGITPLGQYLRDVSAVPGVPASHDAGLPVGDGAPSRVLLVDADGTGHVFAWNAHAAEYRAPAGVHLYLQRLRPPDSGPQDPARVWVMTRPDRTRFVFGADGAPTSVTDRNGNTLTFRYGDPAGAPRRTLTALVDPAGRTTLRFSYDGGFPARLRTVTDLSGRRTELVHDAQGRLIRLVEAAGSPVERSFGFVYGGPAPAACGCGGGGAGDRLTVIVDPLGHRTVLGYEQQGRVRSVTDRRNATTLLGYASAPRGSAGTELSTVTGPDRRATAFLLDPRGRTVQSTDALGETTVLTWNDDNNLVRTRAPDGATRSWTFDPLTGYPLTLTDAVANAAGGQAATALTYRTALGGHIADLVAKVSPEGRSWHYAYDDRGNLLTVTDPMGGQTGYRYDSFGERVESTDADGHTTRFSDFTDSGQARTAVDPMGFTRHSEYDVLGHPVQITGPDDPGQPPRISRTRYDQLGRPLDASTAVTATRTLHRPAPIYDANDEVLVATDPMGAVTTSRYDPMGDLLSVTAPSHDAHAPPPTTQSRYDATGLLIAHISPAGNSTTFRYDAVGRKIEQTDALGGRTTYRYDSAGQLTAEIGPRGNADPHPEQWAWTFAYDQDHRLIRETDPSGAYRVRQFDLDGLEVARTDRSVDSKLRSQDALADHLTKVQYDALGRIARTDVPYLKRADGGIEYHSTAYAYDPVGHRTALFTPRAVASGSTQAYIERYDYDADGRLTVDHLPYAPGDKEVGSPDEIRYGYDSVGDRTQVSNPPPAGQSRRLVTTSTYTANGWLAASTDPWSITTGYRYDDDHRQIQRVLTGDGGAAVRTMGWTYYPDGSLRGRDDSGAPAGGDTVVVDDSDPNSTRAVGDWGTTGSAGRTDVEGYDYRSRPAGDGSATFTWNALAPTTGDYRIAVRLPDASAAAAAAHQEYTVDIDGTRSTAHPGTPDRQGWALLDGTYALVQNHTASVTLSDKAGPGGGRIVADAVRFTRAATDHPNPHAKSFTYRYDPDGNVVDIHDSSADAPVGDYTARYDALDRAVHIAGSGAGQPAVDYGYDGDGDTVLQKYGDRTDTYRYDHRDLPEHSVNQQPGTGPIATDYTFDPAGRLAQETEGNHDKVDLSYNLDNSLQRQQIHRADGTLVADHQLEYDPDGSRSKDTARVMDADAHGSYLSSTTTYDYDPRERLTHLHRTGRTRAAPDEDETYRHDGDSNVTEQTVGGTTTRFRYDRNRLTGATADGTDYGYEYDTLGRLSTVTRDKQLDSRRDYDGFDRQIRTVLHPVGGAEQTTDFAYDSLDRQTSATTGKVTTRHHYLGLSGTDVSDQDGSTTTDYLYAPTGDRLAQTRDGETSYYGYDAHADVELITDEQGNTRSTYGYTAYGNDDPAAFTGKDKPAPSGPSGPTGPTGPGGKTAQPYNAYRFNSMRFDGPTAQYDMGARDYAPGVDSFTSRDAYDDSQDDLGLGTDPLTMNRYAFGGGNPIDSIEYDGHWALWDAISDAASSVGHFVTQHAADIAGAAAGIAVFAGCEAAVTAGSAGTLSAPGAIGCGAAAGAAAGAVSQGVNCLQKGGEACSGKSFATSVVAGAVGGAVGAGVGAALGGGAAGSLAGRVLQGVGRGAAAGAAGGAAGGATGYGLSCGSRCSLSGLAGATLHGAETGAIAGGLGGGISGARGGGGSGEEGGPAKIPVYRGTDRMMENQIASDTGMAMSEAAQRGYVESGGSVDSAMQSSQQAHSSAVSEWGSEDELAQAHGEFGTELQQAYGPRSVMSFTTDPATAKYFANGGTVYRAMIDPAEGIWQSLPDSGESEVLIRHMIGVEPWTG